MEAAGGGRVARRHWGLFGLLLLAALAIRLDSLVDPPFEFHPVRQFRAALVARGFWYAIDRAAAESVAPRRLAAMRQAADLDRLELPILEGVAAGLYTATGEERLWLPRAVSTIAWLAAAVPLFLIGVRAGGPAGGIAAACVFLFVPLGVHASRSFQPDALMLSAIVFAWWTMLRRIEAPSRPRLLAAALMAAAAVTIKPVALFFVVPPFLLLAVHGRGWREAIRDRGVPAFLALVALPTAWYVTDMLTAGSGLAGQAGESFMPGLLLTGEYWVGWLTGIENAVSLPGALLALAASLALARGRLRILLAALWLGYLVFGLVFNRHIATHDIYSVFLVPLAALALAASMRLAERLPRRLWPAAEAVASGLLVASLGAMVFAWHAHWRASAAPFAELPARYAAIGEAIDHGRRGLVLGDNLGRYPFLYYGQAALGGWPPVFRRSAGLDAAREIAGMRKPPHYFVVLDPAGLALQPDLQELLRPYPLALSGPGFLVYDLRRRPAP